MPDARVAPVTGASSGMGAAIAGHLSQSGFRVFGASRRAPAEAAGVVDHVTADVDDDVSVRTGIDLVLREAGRVDVLVNRPSSPRSSGRSPVAHFEGGVRRGFKLAPQNG